MVLVSTTVPLGYRVALYLLLPLFFEIFKTCLLVLVMRADISSPGLCMVELEKIDNNLFLVMLRFLSKIKFSGISC